MQKTGVGIRVLNFLVDTLLIFGITYGASAWWDFHVMYWSYPPAQFYTLFFMVLFIYYTIFEALFKRSPGKWLSKSKVVNKNGGKPAFWQILVRSLVRLTIIDCFFIPFFDGPLHDYLSQTAVTEA
ncbi:RDD family protein [Parafilimonas sp.]|uniref:RDD family protein n=1 Tax=Parafilimonas sp. TaxID=1969739 RepID=UPI0039E44CA7